jgi:uncharacterized membrane protein
MSPTLRARPAGPPAAAVRTSGGIGRRSNRAAERVSDALRRHDSPDLRRRRGAVALTLVATGALALVEAYQTGLIRHLPEPPLPHLDGDRVDAAGEAYVHGRTPDAGLAIASYGATLALLGAGADDRAEEHPWIPVLAAAKVLADAGSAAYLFVEQVTAHRRVCGWCTLAAAANIAAVPLVLPEALRGLRTLRGRP